MLRVGIVSGEASGDLLGSELIESLKTIYPEIYFEGIGGPLMESAGCKILYPSEKLAVMGLLEVAGRYLELVSIRKKLIQHYISNPPDIFIGIDSPDFNLTLEEHLRRSGIKTVHYVGPTVWAWRSGRLAKIKKAVDLMLVLFPFELPIYRNYGINAKYVGHPIIERFQSVNDKAVSKKKLGIDPSKKVIAIMPGSRDAEIRKILPLQLDIMKCVYNQNKDLVFISSVLKQETINMIMEQFSAKVDSHEKPDFRIFKSQTHDVLLAADAGILTSGTITLEAMLCQLPMIVMYKMNWLSYKIIKLLIKVKYVALPNLLAGKEVVPEYIQNNCVPEKMANNIINLLDKEACHLQINEFNKITSLLRQGVNNKAAVAIQNLL